MPTKLKQLQAKRVKRVRSQSPPSAVSKAEVERRRKNPNLRDEQIEIERRTLKRMAERYQKDAARAMRKDAEIKKTAKAAGAAASKRALSGAGRAAPLVGAVAAGAKAVKDVVEPRAAKAKAERESYNKRASTSQAKAARNVRAATSGQRMKTLKKRSNTVKTKKR